MQHDYLFQEIIGWWLHGMKQQVLYWIPVLNPDPETGYPPAFWLDWFPSSLWWDNLDADYRPNLTWISYWNQAVRLTLRQWIIQEAIIQMLNALEIVRGFTGYVLYGYVTFEEWLTAIRGRVASWVPVWTTTLADGIHWLWMQLPLEVREAGADLAQWISDLFDAFWITVQDFYAQTVSDVLDIIEWVWGIGETIHGWYLRVVEFIDIFVAAPVACVKYWLGDVWAWVETFFSGPTDYVIYLLGYTWTLLETFAGTCLIYWYNLWGAYATELADFLANPAAWIYDRVEDELISRW